MEKIFLFVPGRCHNTHEIQCADNGGNFLSNDENQTAPIVALVVRGVRVRMLYLCKLGAALFARRWLHERGVRKQGAFASKMMAARKSRFKNTTAPNEGTDDF